MDLLFEGTFPVQEQAWWLVLMHYCSVALYVKESARHMVVSVCQSANW